MPRTARPSARRSAGCTSPSATYRPRLTNRRGPAGGGRPRARCGRSLDAAQNELLAAELKFQTGFGKGALPKGAIHGDLFCDNVLFFDRRVSGIIDFGFAATDFLAYDLAIAVNDWCIVDDGAQQGALVPELVAAMAGAYDGVRPLTADERAQWAALLRAAALRFWLSRLYDLHLPRPGELTHAHDPAQFERILRDRVAHRAAVSRAAACGAGNGAQAMSAGPDGIAFARLRRAARRRCGCAMRTRCCRLARAAVAVLLLLYYLILGLIDLLPYVGTDRGAVLKPVFAVGFLAAAWSQERGGTPQLGQLVRGFRSNLWALLPLGVVLLAGITLSRCWATALVDGGKLLDALSGKDARRRGAAGRRAGSARDAVRRRCARCR